MFIYTKNPLGNADHFERIFDTETGITYTYDLHEETVSITSIHDARIDCALLYRLPTAPGFWHFIRSLVTDKVKQ